MFKDVVLTLSIVPVVESEQVIVFRALMYAIFLFCFAGVLLSLSLLCEEQEFPR